MGPSAMASRIRTAIPAELVVQGRRGTVQIRNLSRGGLFVSTRARIAQGELVELRFRMPSGEPMTVSGLVWWTTRERARGNGRSRGKPGFGLRLIDENEAYESAVGRLFH